MNNRNDHVFQERDYNLPQEENFESSSSSSEDEEIEKIQPKNYWQKTKIVYEKNVPAPFSVRYLIAYPDSAGQLKPSTLYFYKDENEWCVVYLNEDQMIQKNRLKRFEENLPSLTQLFSDLDSFKDTNVSKDCLSIELPPSLEESCKQMCNNKLLLWLTPYWEERTIAKKNDQRWLIQPNDGQGLNIIFSYYKEKYQINNLYRVQDCREIVDIINTLSQTEPCQYGFIVGMTNCHVTPIIYEQNQIGVKSLLIFDSIGYIPPLLREGIESINIYMNTGYNQHDTNNSARQSDLQSCKIDAITLLKDILKEHRLITAELSIIKTEKKIDGMINYFLLPARWCKVVQRPAFIDGPAFDNQQLLFNSSKTIQAHRDKHTMPTLLVIKKTLKNTVQAVDISTVSRNYNHYLRNKGIFFHKKIDAYQQKKRYYQNDVPCQTDNNKKKSRT